MCVWLSAFRRNAINGIGADASAGPTGSRNRSCSQITHHGGRAENAQCTCTPMDRIDRWWKYESQLYIWNGNDRFSDTLRSTALVAGPRRWGTLSAFGVLEEADWFEPPKVNSRILKMTQKLQSLYYPNLELSVSFAVLTWISNFLLWGDAQRALDILSERSLVLRFGRWKADMQRQWIWWIFLLQLLQLFSLFQFSGATICECIQHRSCWL